MDFSISDDDRSFVASLTDWLDRNLDPDWDEAVDSEEDWLRAQTDWEHRLAAGGWTGIHWPVEYGGCDATATQRALYADVLARRGAPEGIGHTGRRLLGPAIIRYGTPEQRRAILPPILKAQTIWCQGFSEPNAGSDLASLATRADRRGDSYLINGSKIWTTHAQYADKIMLLCRTDPQAEKHAGISLLLVDLKQPGIAVRPIEQVGGHREFCEVHFENASTAIENVVGREGQGWEIALFVLNYERGAVMVFDGLVKVEEHLKRYAAIALGDRSEWARVGKAATEVATSRLLALRILSNQINGGDPGQEASIVKLYWTSAWVRLAEEALLFGGESLLSQPRHGTGREDLADLYWQCRAYVMGGGSSEVQRNIIAHRLLGMPKA